MLLCLSFGPFLVAAMQQIIPDADELSLIALNARQNKRAAKGVVSRQV